ncbi:MAG: SDR family oxidoreductase [Clostridia bacterium]|nr:SDR family oxidoreductase [Clostridia bacterium]
MKTALITGASGKIGSEIVKKFVLDGYFVIGQYNEGETNIVSLKKELSSLGLKDTFFAFKCDLSVKESVDEFIQSVNASFKHIDALVCNAGADLYKLCTDTTELEWDYLFSVNCKSAFSLTKAFLPAMIERKYGKIVYISSIWGQKGSCMETCYSATKSALIGFGRALAKEVGPSGINVNCVCPGVIDTPMNDRFNEQEKLDLIDQTPMGKMGTPEDVANAVRFLCSADADFITGVDLTVDGGFAL